LHLLLSWKRRDMFTMIECAQAEDVRRDELYSWRKQAYEQFLSLKQAPFEYISFSSLAIPAPAAAPNIEPSAIAKQIIPECTHCLVFVDGFFIPETSRVPSELILLPLDIALQTYGLFLQNRWANRWKGETDPFCALNGAFHGRGAF